MLMSTVEGRKTKAAGKAEGKGASEKGKDQAAGKANESEEAAPEANGSASAGPFPYLVIIDYCNRRSD